ncbi:MAG: thymidylate kinase [Oscillospiraceae bacterium]|jgi:dTMP kinase|nr:thymidylate kinase [Oscillospiraceae bacterium]
MSGKLIVIEGPDGSGKTTQFDMLRRSLNGPVFVSFPNYESDSGRVIKRYLNGEFGGCGAYPASSFYAVDRYASYVTRWAERYLGGTDVICARYTSSNAIYQMAKLPRNEWEGFLEWLYDYEYDKLGIPRPFATFYLDVPLAVSRELVSRRCALKGESKDIHEGDGAYLEKCFDAASFAARRGGWRRVECMDGGRLKSPGDVNRVLTALIGGCLND